MSNYFRLISTVLESVFLDFNSPFTYIFGCFLVLGFIILIFYILFGDR